MLYHITYGLKKLAAIFKWSTNLDQLPEALKALSDYLNNEPDKNFSYFEKYGNLSVPLTVNDEALKSLESALSKFPDIVRSGKVQTKPHPLNIVITIGQMLTHVVILFDLYTNPIHPEEVTESLKKNIKHLYDIWGTDNLNVMFLTHKYSGKTIAFTKRDLSNKLRASADIIKEKIIPEIKAIQK